MANNANNNNNSNSNLNLNPNGNGNSACITNFYGSISKLDKKDEAQTANQQPQLAQQPQQS